MAHPAAASTPHPNHRNSLNSALSPLDTSTPRPYQPIHAPAQPRHTSIVRSPHLPNDNGCRARFEFESGKGNEGTKILMVEWDVDVDPTGGTYDGDEWHIWWEGKTVVLPANDRKGGSEEVTRFYYLLPPGVSVPAVITLTKISFKKTALTDGEKEERNGSKSPSTQERTFRANPLPAIYPPELGATARTAGKKGVLHTKWAKARLRALQKEIEEETKKNVEGVGLIMAMQEKEWIEKNFGVSSRPAHISIDGVDLSGAEVPRSPPAGARSPTSPRSPGGSRLSEKLKGLKLGTSDKDLGTARQSAITLSMSGGSVYSNPLSPEGSDVAVSSYAAIRGTNPHPVLPKSPLANRPFIPPTPMTAVRMMPQSPPPQLVQQQWLAELSSLNAVAVAQTPTTAISTSSSAFSDIKGERSRPDTPRVSDQSATGSEAGSIGMPETRMSDFAPADEKAATPTSEDGRSYAEGEAVAPEEARTSGPVLEPIVVGSEGGQETEEVKTPVVASGSELATVPDERSGEDGTLDALTPTIATPTATVGTSIATTAPPTAAVPTPTTTKPALPGTSSDESLETSVLFGRRSPTIQAEGKEVDLGALVPPLGNADPNAAPPPTKLEPASPVSGPANVPVETKEIQESRGHGDRAEATPTASATEAAKPDTETTVDNAVQPNKAPGQEHPSESNSGADVEPDVVTSENVKFPATKAHGESSVDAVSVAVRSSVGVRETEPVAANPMGTAASAEKNEISKATEEPTNSDEEVDTQGEEKTNDPTDSDDPEEGLFALPISAHSLKRSPFEAAQEAMR